MSTSSVGGIGSAMSAFETLYRIVVKNVNYAITFNAVYQKYTVWVNHKDSNGTVESLLLSKGEVYALLCNRKATEPFELVFSPKRTTIVKMTSEGAEITQKLEKEVDGVRGLFETKLALTTTEMMAFYRVLGYVVEMINDHAATVKA